MPREAGGLDLPAGGQDAERNGQVEPAGVLGQVCRRQVDCDIRGSLILEQSSDAPAGNQIPNLLYLG